MALAERQEGDAEQLQKVIDFNAQLETHVTDQLLLTHEKTEELIKSLPQADILNRLLICDSQGQHKSRRAQRRLEAEEVEAIEVKTVEVPVIPQGAAATDIDDYSIF